MNTEARPKRALVTGGSGEIGAALCRRLAERYRVIVHANSRLEGAEELARQIGADGGDAIAVAFDLTDAASCAVSIDRLLLDGPIQVLVNNAGIHDDETFAGMRPEQWKRVIDVSLNGFFNVTQPLTLPMVRTRWGRIISISSVAALLGNRGQVNYAAAKSALHGASKALAIELASRGVTVNVVAPGIIATEMSGPFFDQARIDAVVPMRRAGTVGEVADLVDFLASDRAAYITGQVISINGGMI